MGAKARCRAELISRFPSAIEDLTVHTVEAFEPPAIPQAQLDHPEAVEADQGVGDRVPEWVGAFAVAAGSRDDLGDPVSCSVPDASCGANRS